MKRLGWVLLAGCGGASSGPIANTEPVPRALCIDPAAPGGTALVLDREEMETGHVLTGGDDRGAHAILGGPWGAHAAIDDGAGGGVAVVARKDCGGLTCDPKLVRLADGRLAATARLPGTERLAEHFDYPFVTEWLALEDVDGDGTRELWVSYNVVSEPEPVVGSTTKRHVAAFALPDLRMLWHAEHSSWPEASTADQCEAKIAIVDADCDGARDLVVTRTCDVAHCAREEPEQVPGECAREPPVEHAVFVRAADGHFEERR